MGLLDDILKSALGGPSASGAQASSLVESVLELLNDRQGGGLEALIQGFQSQGLGELISSWVGTGANRSISAEQLVRVLGAGRVSDLARRAGLSDSLAPGVLAALLPALIDKLTPDGEVPQRALLADRGRGLLSSIDTAFGATPQTAVGAPRPRADFSDVQGGSSSTAPPPAAAEAYVVVAGDSLSRIAKRFYGDANDWRRIYEANRTLIGGNPDLIVPGQKLTIPKA